MAGKEGNIKVSIRNVVKKYDTRNGEMIALNGANLDNIVTASTVREFAKISF